MNLSEAYTEYTVWLAHRLQTVVHTMTVKHHKTVLETIDMCNTAIDSLK